MRFPFQRFFYSRASSIRAESYGLRYRATKAMRTTTSLCGWTFGWVSPKCFFCCTAACAGLFRNMESSPNGGKYVLGRRERLDSETLKNPCRTPPTSPKGKTTTLFGLEVQGGKVRRSCKHRVATEYIERKRKHWHLGDRGYNNIVADRSFACVHLLLYYCAYVIGDWGRRFSSRRAIGLKLGIIGSALDGGAKKPKAKLS